MTSPSRKSPNSALLDLLITHYDELEKLMELTSHDTSIDGDRGK